MLVALLSLLLCCGMSPLRAQDLQHRDVTIRDTLPAAVKTDRRRIEERLPGTFSTDLKVLRGKVLSPVGENDPIKYALTRPGVSSGAEGFSAFFARGGNLGNNLFTLDGVRIYGLSHLLGLTTSVPGDAIETMDFCVGGFGGEQGGLTASHVSLHSASLDHKTLKTAASLSNTFLGATVSAPVVREKASVLASVRWSPFGLEYGLLKKSFDKEGRMPDLQMGVWDAYVKAAVSLSPRHEVTVSGFGSRDGYMIGPRCGIYAGLGERHGTPVLPFQATFDNGEGGCFVQSLPEQHGTRDGASR